MKKLIVFIVILIVALLMFLALRDGLDKSVDNQTVMLCKSALKSGNIDYQKKCYCYYRSGDISCVR